EAEPLTREAVDLFREAEKACETPVGHTPKDLARAHHLVDIRHGLADLLVGARRYEEAELVTRRAVADGEKWTAELPQWEEGRLDLGHSLWRQAVIRTETQRYAEAEQIHRRALAVFEKLAADFPKNPFHRFEQGYSWWYLVDLFQRAGRPADVEA